MTTEQLSVFFQERMPFCGCGNPQAAGQCLMELLELHPLYDSHPAFEERFPDEGLHYLILYWIDSLDLTEHGTTITGGWLTDRGRELRDALRREYDADQMESLFDQRCVHGHLVDDRTHDCFADERA